MRYDSRMSPLAVTIRPARIGDAPRLARAEREIAREPGFLVSQPAELLDERFAQKIVALAGAENGRYVVAEVDGQIVGHALLDPLALAATRHVTHLTVAVHPGWQRRGLGRALLEHLLEWARRAPAVEKIELHVRSSNTGAQALYRSVGFTEMGRWRRRVKLAPGTYLDDVAMELWVGPAVSA
jgi:ribosomal protein S18 acetylase RimI-like enzyme